jgi:hypothetical protein
MGTHTPSPGKHTVEVLDRGDGHALIKFKRHYGRRPSSTLVESSPASRTNTATTVSASTSETRWRTGGAAPGPRRRRGFTDLGADRMIVGIPLFHSGDAEPMLDAIAELIALVE